MNILFVNLRSDVQGHKFFDSLYVDSLSRNGRVYLMTPPDWYDHEFSENVTPIVVKTAKNPYVDLIRKIRAIRRAVGRNRIDLVVLSTFFVNRMPLILRFLCRKGLAVALVHHNTVDLLSEDEKTARTFVKYRDRVYHFVFESYIRDHLVNDFGTDGSRVFVIPHPLIDRRTPSDAKTFDCVSLGNAGDESVIEAFVEKEKNERVFEKAGLCVYFKSKTVEFDDGYLTVKKGYLSNEEFGALMRSAKRALIFYPPSYHYRVSGVAMEAVGYGARIVANPIELFRRYAEEYPGLIEWIERGEDLLPLLSNAAPDGDACVERFIADHSVDTVARIMADAFARISGQTKRDRG